MGTQADPTFAPCPVDDGDELFPNGIFVFNVTRILEHVARHPAEVALVPVSVRSFPRWDRPLADAHVEAADLARPVLLAEISPGSFNSIDWTLRENVRAHQRVLGQRILRKHGYPPDKQETARRFPSSARARRSRTASGSARASGSTAPSRR